VSIEFKLPAADTAETRIGYWVSNGGDWVEVGGQLTLFGERHKSALF